MSDYRVLRCQIIFCTNLLVNNKIRENSSVGLEGSVVSRFQYWALLYNMVSVHGIVNVNTWVLLNTIILL